MLSKRGTEEISLKDFVVSLETAKKLAEANIKIDSLCVYGKSRYYEGIQKDIFGIYRKNSSYFIPDRLVDAAGHSQEVYEIISAPTSDELEKYLSKSYSEYDMRLVSTYDEGKIKIEYYNPYENSMYYESTCHENKADAIAEIVTHLEQETTKKWGQKWVNYIYL